MVSAVEIRKLVSRYLVRSIDLEAFAEGFADLFYDIEDNGDREAVTLSYSVESELAKHAEGLFDEPVLRNSLIACIQADTSQSPIYNHVLVEPKRDESMNCVASMSESEPIYALATT